MRSHALAGAALVVPLVLQSVAWAAAEREEARTITVEGVSAHSHSEAEEDALRKAVRQGAGAYLRSKQAVSDFQLVHDCIVSRARGYVKEYERLDEWESKDGAFYVKVRAVVVPGKVSEDWGAVELLVKLMGRPNLLIQVGERAAGVAPTEGVAQSQLTDLFEERDIELVDPDAVEALKKRLGVRAEAAGDTRKAKALPVQLYASYEVKGTLDIRAGQPRKTYGLTSTPVTATLVVKIYATGSGKLLATKSGAITRASREPSAAAAEATKRVVADVGSRAMFRMLEHWARALDVGKTVMLHGTRIDTEVLATVVERLGGEVEGVETVSIVDHNPELSTVKMVGRLKLLSILRELQSLSGGRLRVTGMEQGRVDFEMKATPPRPKKPGAMAPAPRNGEAVAAATAPEGQPPGAGTPPQEPAGRLPSSLLLVGGGVVLAVAAGVVVVPRALRRWRG